MGTYYTVHLWTEGRISQDQIESDIETLLDEFEHQLSNWRDDSWINKFNELPAGESIAVPDHAFEVITLFLELAERSDGNLDPTVGPLVELWGFGVDRDRIVPKENAIAEALDFVGYQKIVLDEKSRMIEKTMDGVQLNCSAVAKGYAVDLVASLLVGQGIENFLINIGGEVLAKGTNDDGLLWKIGIERPSSMDAVGESEFVALSNQALATSGHTQRFFEHGGVRYSHIMNPKTGWPVPIGTLSASVVAPSCGVADGLATLALILDEEHFELVVQTYDGAMLTKLRPEVDE